MFGVKFLGSGSYLPERVLANEFFVNNGPYYIFKEEGKDGPIWETDEEGKIKEVHLTDDKMFELSGIKQRRAVTDGQTVFDLAHEAILAALENAKITAKKLRGIICGSVTQERRTPSMACRLQDKLGASNVVYAIDISAGCTGFVHALWNVRNLIQLDGVGAIAVIGAETLTRHLDKDRNCFLFGDGASCLIFDVTQEEKYMHFAVSFNSEACRGKTKMLFIDLQNVLRMPNNRRVFQLGTESMIEQATLVKKMLAKSLKISVGEMDKLASHYIPHQANIRMLNQVAQKLGPEKMIINIEKYGNTSAATIPIAFDEAWRAGVIKRDEFVIMPSFGAGFAIACAGFRV